LVRAGLLNRPEPSRDIYELVAGLN
jgi:hypothetical protein